MQSDDLLDGIERTPLAAMLSDDELRDELTRRRAERRAKRARPSAPPVPRSLSEAERERMALRDLEDAIAFSQAPRTLTEIAARIGLSRERVRQIEEAALSKLKGRLSRRRMHFEALLDEAPMRHVQSW